MARWLIELEGPVMKLSISSKTILSRIVASGIIAGTLCFVFSGVGIAGERHGVFASCQTRDDGPRLRLEIVKRWDPEGGGDWIEAKVSTLPKESAQWVSRWIRGQQLDLGRDPICEVYQFPERGPDASDAGDIRTEVGVCFERRNDGTYGGYILHYAEEGSVIERRLSCVF